MASKGLAVVTGQSLAPAMVAPDSSSDRAGYIRAWMAGSMYGFTSSLVLGSATAHNSCSAVLREAGDVPGVDELQVRHRMRQRTAGIRLPCRAEGIERRLHGKVPDGMDVHDHTASVGLHDQIIEARWVEQQRRRSDGVEIWLGYGRGLRGGVGQNT